MDGPGILPTPEEIAAREQAERDQRERDNRELLTELQRRQAAAQTSQAKSNATIASLTAALVLMAFASAFVAYLQFSAAKESADAAKSAAKTANEALKSSNQSSTQTLAEMRSQSAAMSSAAAAQQQTADRLRDQITRLDAARQSSEKQSADALKETIRISNEDRRAWVGIAGIKSEGVRLSGDVLAMDRLSIVIQNSGKSPALALTLNSVGPRVADYEAPILDYDAVMASSIEAIKRDFAHRRELAENEGRARFKDHPEITRDLLSRLAEEEAATLDRNQVKRNGILAPGATMEMTFTPFTNYAENVGAKVAIPIVRYQNVGPNGSNVRIPIYQAVYFLGKITYTDTVSSGHVHSTKYCLTRDPADMTKFAVCPDANWME